MKFFRQLLTETREACELVTLRYDNVDRQTHAENQMRLPEFFVETVGLLFDLGATFVSQLSVTDEVRTRNRQHQTIERSLRPVLLQQSQDRIPATVARGPVVAQHEVTRDVEHNALVEEIPIQLSIVFVDEVFD